MSKYNDYYGNAYKDFDYDEELLIKQELRDGETVLWKGKPKKSAKVLNSIFSAMFPFVMIWLLIDGTIISSIVFASVSGGDFDGSAWFFVVFFAVHLMPVWIWLGGIIKALMNTKYDVYVATSQRLLIKSQNVLFESILYEDIVNIVLKRSIADRLAGTGDVSVDIAGRGKEDMNDVPNYEELKDIISSKVMELRRNGHNPGAMYEGMNNGTGMYQGNNYESHLDIFMEGQQMDKTQYVINGQFVNGPYNQGPK